MEKVSLVLSVLQLLSMSAAFLFHKQHYKKY